MTIMINKTIHRFPLNGLHEQIQECKVCSCSPSIYIEMRNMPKSRLCECCGRASKALPASPILLLSYGPPFFIFPDWLERCFTRTSLTRPLQASLVIVRHAAGVKGPHGKRVQMLTIFDEGLSLGDECSWQALPVQACSATEGDVDADINKLRKMAINDHCWVYMHNLTLILLKL